MSQGSKFPKHSQEIRKLRNVYFYFSPNIHLHFVSLSCVLTRYRKSLYPWNFLDIILEVNGFWSTWPQLDALRLATVIYWVFFAPYNSVWCPAGTKWTSTYKTNTINLLMPKRISSKAHDFIFSNKTSIFPKTVHIQLQIMKFKSWPYIISLRTKRCQKIKCLYYVDFLFRYLFFI